MKARRLIIRIAAVLVLVVIGVIMSIIGRGHTIYWTTRRWSTTARPTRHPIR